MRALARFLIRLYPASWRARYGEEFEALLEDSSPRWPAILDLLKGAIKMQLSVPTFPKLALMLSVGGLLIGLLVSFSIAPIYISESVVTLETSATTSRDLYEYILARENEVLSRTSLSSIIHDPRLDLYPEERARMPLEDVIETMRTRSIRIRTVTPPNAGQGHRAFSISFAYRDRVKAQHTLQALITRFQEATLKSQLNLKVLDPASLPVNPTRPKRYVFMFSGFVAGLVAASVTAIFRRRVPPVPYPAQTA